MHDVNDAISLEIGKRVAARLRQDPRVLQIARENLARWSHRNADSASLLRCYAEWQILLDRPLEEICQILQSDDEESRRLRQNSPFAGVLTASELWSLKSALRHAKSAA